MVRGHGILDKYTIGLSALSSLWIRRIMILKPTLELLTDAKRPGGILKGGRLEIGVTG